MSAGHWRRTAQGEYRGKARPGRSRRPAAITINGAADAGSVEPPVALAYPLAGPDRRPAAGGFPRSK